MVCVFFTLSITPKIERKCIVEIQNIEIMVLVFIYVFPLILVLVTKLCFNCWVKKRYLYIRAALRRSIADSLYLFINTRVCIRIHSELLNE